MRIEEARWIGQTLASVPATELNPLIQLGSSTEHFRTREQPHIDAYIEAPLRERGVNVIHSDLKADAGVDISGDFSDPAVRSELKAVRARAVVCSNMFEHVTDRERLAAVCDDILVPGGLLVVTVPHSYPVHLDPIDTYYRPAPEEIAALFPRYDQIAGELIPSQTFLQEFRASREKLTILRNVLVGLLTPWRGRQRMLARVHRLMWLFRPYDVSGVVLRKRR